MTPRTASARAAHTTSAVPGAISIGTMRVSNRMGDEVGVAPPDAAANSGSNSAIAAASHPAATNRAAESNSSRLLNCGRISVSDDTGAELSGKRRVASDRRFETRNAKVAKDSTDVLRRPSRLAQAVPATPKKKWTKKAALDALDFEIA